jgi:hypothetical protein
MAMPKASVHENNLLVPRQHDVGLSRQITVVEAEPEPHSMDDPAHPLFG